MKGRTSFAEDVGRRVPDQFTLPGDANNEVTIDDLEEHKVIDAVFAKWVKPDRNSKKRKSSKLNGAGYAAENATPESLHPVVETARRENRRALLQTGDLTRSKGLATKFKQYRLRDYFDSSGQRRYRNISMSFASRQSEDRDADLNKRSRENISTRDQTAREARLAAEMIHRDRVKIHEDNMSIFNSLASHEQELKSELLKRREDNLFIEIPQWEKYLPESVTVMDLMCPLLSIEKERTERKQAERQNADTGDDQKTSRQGWLLTPNQLKEIIKVLQLCRTALGTEWSFGIDRSTYFRFMYDLHVIDEEYCPSTFVASCFDENARPLRMTKMESWVGDDVLATAPMVMMCSYWGFAAALNSCIQHKYGGAPDAAFFAHLDDESRRLTKVAQAVALGASAKLDSTEEQAPTMNQSKRGSFIPNDSMRAKRRGEVEVDHNANAMKLFCVRERWIACMLVEPEVQEYVTAYASLWTKLFECYTGKFEEGIMSFEEFLQFARDWCIIPRLASTHVVLRAYRAAECLAKENKNLLKGALEKRSKQASNGHHKSESQESEGDIQRTLKPGELFATEPTNAVHVPEKKHVPEKGIALEGFYTPAGLTVRKGFGLACFTEAICRASFHYLAVNGNNIQQATSSKAKILWFLTYLRSVWLCASESAARSPKKARSEGMTKCLEVITDDMFSQSFTMPKIQGDDKPAPKMGKLPPLAAERLEDTAKNHGYRPEPPTRRTPDSEEIKQLRVIFEKCDKSGDGKIRKWELMKACRTHHDIAQFLRLPDKYGDDPEAGAMDHRGSPSNVDGHRGSHSQVTRHQEFTEHFVRFFDEVQEGGTGDATEDNELDFEEFKNFYAHLVEADELAKFVPFQTPTPEPLDESRGKKHWHLRSLCTRGLGNSAPVALSRESAKPMWEDLNDWYGRVGKSCVTPPPLNDFSRTIEKRLEDMILDKQRRE